MLSACSYTYEGLSVGNVTNSDCLDNTRSAESLSEGNTTRRSSRAGDNSIPSYRLRLTRKLRVIKGELPYYPVCCNPQYVKVECRQEGDNLYLQVLDGSENTESGSTCVCHVNIGFTLYGIEGSEFHVVLERHGSLEDLGVASFKNQSTVDFP